MKTFLRPLVCLSRLRSLSHARRHWTFMLVAGALAALGTGPAQAQFDDFNDGNDAGWTRYDPLAPFGAAATFSFPGGAYRIEAAPSPDPGSLGAGRAGSIREDVSYTMFQISYDLVDWDNSMNQAFGILGRVSDVGLGTTAGYAFTYSTSGSINLSVITGEAPSGVGSASVTLDPANSYRFVFTGVGDSLTGEVFNLADLSTALATVNGVDATYASGFGGLVVFDNTGGLGADATFDNYLAVVPEPSVVTLFGVGAFLLFWRLRRGRR